MTKKMFYHTVASQAELPSGFHHRFLLYMLARWPEGVAEDYAIEWADRFRKGTEFAYADNEGRALLIEAYTNQ